MAKVARRDRSTRRRLIAPFVFAGRRLRGKMVFCRSQLLAFGLSLQASRKKTF